MCSNVVVADTFWRMHIFNGVPLRTIWLNLELCTAQNPGLMGAIFAAARCTLKALILTFRETTLYIIL